MVLLRSSLIIALFAQAGLLVAQVPPSPEWMRPILATRAQFINALETDAAGNVYVTGYVTGALELDGIRLDGAGRGDPFLLKFDPAGRVLWARQGTGPGWSGGRAIAIDAGGDVYWAGRFQEQIVFGTDTLRSAGKDDIFIARYTSGGDPLWVRRIGGAGVDWGNGLAVDEHGGAFVAGWFEEDIDVNGESLRSGGDSDPLLARFGPQGDVVWARAIAGRGADAAYEVAVDGAGVSYLVGSFSADLQFGSQRVETPGDDAEDGFVAAFASDGQPAWIRVLDGPGNNVLEHVATANGGVYVAGSLRDTATFSGQAVSSAGGADLFLARLAPDGAMDWAFTVGGPGDDGFSGFGQSVVIDPSPDGSFRVATAFSDSVTIGEHVLVSNGASDVLIAEFADSHQLEWIATCGGPKFEAFVGLGRGPDDAAYVSAVTWSPEVACGMQSVAVAAGGRFSGLLMKFAGRSVRGSRR